MTPRPPAPTSADASGLDPRLAATMADVRARLAASCATLPPAAFDALVRQISERKLAWHDRDERREGHDGVG